MNNYVYRVKYGRAELLAMSISQLYGYPTMGGFGMGGFGMGMMGGRRGGGGGRMGAMGAGMGSMGMNAMGGYGMGGYNMGGMGMGYPMGGMSAPSYGAMPYGAIVAASPGGLGTTTGGTGTPGSATTTTTTTMPGSQNLTGMYLGAAGGYGMYPPGVPRIVPNPMDNTLLIQATPQDYEQIANLLYQLDIPPRQVLIEAKIYEVSLTGSFAGGVAAALRSRGASGTNDPISGATRLATGDVGVGGLRLTAGLLVGQSRELLGVLTAQEDNRRARLISAPVVVATDSIPAMINVGQDVPVLTSQAVSPVQNQGTSLFTNTIQNRNTGVTLDILATINPSGIVTLEIAQEVSAPVAPSANSAIQSPSFSTRTVSTQVTVQDGDTVAIGGIIQESYTDSSAGVPYLHRIPGIGLLFGSKSTSRERTELVVFLTPRVIYDTNQITDATEELKSKMRRVQRLMSKEKE
jgi:general secretion pathway protein D